MDNLEQLAEAYDKELLSRKKDRILIQIFKAYQPLILKLCRQYRKIEEPEVITQHIRLAIALALTNRKNFNDVKASIFSHIRREMVENIIRPYYRLKTSVGKNINFSDCMYKEEKYIHEIEDKSGDKIAQSIIKVDIDRVMHKLPSKEYEMIKLWLQGYSLKEIKAFMGITSELYSYSIYYHFKKAKKHLLTLLPGYSYEFR